MPYYFECCDENYLLFTGVNAKENDLLARYGWEQDILFHIGSGISGGHIYLRTKHVINKKSFKRIKKLNDFEDYLDIPINVIEQCLQLAKQYSSKGRKEKTAQIHITPWLNVKKYDGDNHGTIAFMDSSLVKILYTSTDKNMVDSLQETRYKKKLTEDNMRQQRDTKYEYNESNINFNKYKSFNLSINNIISRHQFYPLLALNYHHRSYRFRPNMIRLFMRRLAF